MSDLFSSLSDQMSAAVERAAPSVVQVHTSRRAVSAVVFAEDLILAPAHAADDDVVGVRRADGHTLDGALLGHAPGIGLAVVRVPSLGIPPLTPAPEPRVGHLAIAVGRTWSGGTMASVTNVVVVGGPLRTGRATRLERVIRIGHPPHGALTGGALIDGAGGALGIVTGSAIRETTVVVPAGVAWTLGQQAAARGGTRQGFLGVGTTTVELPARQRGDRSERHGLLVTSVAEGGPAGTAGVLVGDVILRFGGTPVSEPEELVALLRGDHVGRPVPLTLLRAGAASEVSVTVGERPRR